MAGVYVHIPYCKQACSYCDFYFSTSRKSEQAFLKALHREIELQQDFFPADVLPLRSLYFGGGTPSLLHPDEIARIIAAVQQQFGLLDDAEITLEANPDDITRAQLKAWRAAGVNRLSIGIQSFIPRELLWMKRAHTAEQALCCVPKAQDAGFERLTIDLIYATPSLSTAEWEQTLEQALAFNVPHLSCYALTIEPQTLLHHQVRKGEVQPPPDANFVEQFKLLGKRTSAAGFRHYEISNLAQPGTEAVHNSNYWKGRPYLGLGPSAHSYDGNSLRHHNLRNVHAYNRSLLENNTLPIAETEYLSLIDRFNELLLLRLRLLEGVPEHAVETLLNQLQYGRTNYERARDALITTGQLQRVAGHLRLSPDARLLADAITAELMV
ncbi:MAG: radical SAM family heme chaperone HemW [Bacteroidota bacterium]